MFSCQLGLNHNTAPGCSSVRVFSLEGEPRDESEVFNTTEWMLDIMWEWKSGNISLFLALGILDLRSYVKTLVSTLLNNGQGHGDAELCLFSIWSRKCSLHAKNFKVLSKIIICCKILIDHNYFQMTIRLVPHYQPILWGMFWELPSV